MADEERSNELRRKFHPALMEMDRRGVRLQELAMRNSKLFLRAVAPTREAANYVWDEIRMIDEDLVDITAEIEIGEPATGGPRAADVEVRRAAARDPEKVQQGGDKGAGTGIV